MPHRALMTAGLNRYDISAHLKGMKLVSPFTSDTHDEGTRLAALACTGCRASFERLARHWHPRLVAHAFRLLGNREQALDAAQSAWVEIARSIRQLRDPRAFPAWSYRIVSRRCAQLISGLQADRSLAVSLQMDDVTDHGMADGFESDIADLQSAVAKLPATQRAAVALFYHEGLSIAETAVALDVPTGTVKTRLMHARHKLAQFLQGDEDVR